MKIIFLDIDGVLNSIQSGEVFKKYGKPCFGGFFKEDELATKDNVLWDETCLMYLREIVEKTNAKIVISSTWRENFSIPKFKEMFAIYGWNNAPIIDKTILLINECRGTEIQDFLNKNKVENYIIIDDVPDMLESQKFNFILTDENIGLSEKKYVASHLYFNKINVFFKYKKTFFYIFAYIFN